MPRGREPERMSSLPFSKADPAQRDFQYLEDLSSAYWYSEVLFAAIELEIFNSIEKGISVLDELASACSCHKQELHRLLKTMESLALIHEGEGHWFNSQTARMYLVHGQPSYLGDYLLYRRYMQPNWQSLVQKVSLNKDTVRSDPHVHDYALRNLNYVKSSDALLREKSKEIAGLLESVPWGIPVLDIGGGAGSLGRALIRSKIPSTNKGGKRFTPDKDNDQCSVLFDLPEVIQAAKKIYRKETDWDILQAIEGDFRNYEFDVKKQYGLVVLSNFLHAYSSEDARAMLVKAVDLLKPGGMILVHDYFPDRRGYSPQKGSLYDLNMMINTYDGMCHESAAVKEWLEQSGLEQIKIRDLSTDSSIITATGNQFDRQMDFDENDVFQEWIYAALEQGFERAVLLSATDIVTGSWVRKKCRFGCKEYGSNLQCPPHGMKSHETEYMIESYSWCLVLEGMPPGRDFHKKLLALEKRAFLAGFHKAFAFGAGPCPVCDECPENNVCRLPDQARPSMEACGMDVYETAKAAGISLKPLMEKGEYVKYIGLLLLE